KPVAAFSFGQRLDFIEQRLDGNWVNNAHQQFKNNHNRRRIDPPVRPQEINEAENQREQRQHDGRCYDPTFYDISEESRMGGFIETKLFFEYESVVIRNWEAQHLGQNCQK